MENFTIKKETLEKVLNYIATKPFSEVAQMVQELQACKPVEEKKEEKKQLLDMQSLRALLLSN